MRTLISITSISTLAATVAVANPNFWNWSPSFMEFVNQAFWPIVAC